MVTHIPHVRTTSMSVVVFLPRTLPQGIPYGVLYSRIVVTLISVVVPHMPQQVLGVRMLVIER